MAWQWRELEIGGKPAVAGEPGQPVGPVILYLHDARGTPPDALAGLTELLQQYRWRCLAPAAGCSWWLQHPCSAFDPELSPEEHLLSRVLPWLEQHWQVTARQWALVGVGMGGQGAIRLGLRHPHRFPIVASIDGALDLQQAWGFGTPLDTIYPTPEAARRDSALMHLHPTDWPEYLWLACSPDSYWYRGNDRLHEKLQAHGVPHTAVLEQELPPEGFLPPLFAYLHTAFQHLSRRLL
ncbi:MAG: alpha/beta hydrolase-fold protein [Gemmataceae bacterium]|nr:alpha/beta hydrolase-fold protein [Gemmataceae bacterium]MCS7270390.1 alpha/beta hydrolase-fold protein [Gemmataceae bacterium]MDW8244262.1 alpha/beta hydrolase-fold protein [Thermogemmata sp.]